MTGGDWRSMTNYEDVFVRVASQNLSQRESNPIRATGIRTVFRRQLGETGLVVWIRLENLLDFLVRRTARRIHARIQRLSETGLDKNDRVSRSRGEDSGRRLQTSGEGRREDHVNFLVLQMLTNLMSLLVASSAGKAGDFRRKFEEGNSCVTTSRMSENTYFLARK